MCGKNQRSNIVGNFTLGSPPRVREKHIVNDNYKFKRVPKVLKPKVKELIAAMVNDEELLAKLTQE